MTLHEDLDTITHLQVSLEGKETFIFKSGSNRQSIQNQAKIYQSDIALIAHIPEGSGGLTRGSHIFPFEIPI